MATVYLSLTLAPGSNAKIAGAGPGCAPATGHPGILSCQTSRAGQVPINYTSSSPLPGGGSDALGAATSLSPATTPALDLYTY